VAVRSDAMADVMSILAANYTAVGLQNPSKTPYKNVDPASYQGTWTGTYNNTKKFMVTVSDVQGFRAQVKYESAGTVKFQSVLIKDNSFRVGDSKFTLNKAGSATVKTAVTDPVTNSTSLITGTAKQST
jgi:hypothetical protein